MSPDAQRIAIAQLHGFQGIGEFTEEIADVESRSISVYKYLAGMLNGKRKPVPEYLISESAMHSALVTLPHIQKAAYAKALVEKHGDYGALFTSAAEQAECLLKSLDLWSETPADSSKEGAREG